MADQFPTIAALVAPDALLEMALVVSRTGVEARDGMELAASRGLGVDGAE